MKRKIVGAIAVWCLLLLAGCSPQLEQQLDRLPLPATTTQVLLVTSTDWDTSEATLRRMEKQTTGWQMVGDAIPVRLGRNGLGWGVGLHKAGVGIQKREGDGKSPAGVFTLGTVFGYAEQAPEGVTLPYRVAGERDYFVDAVDSPDYNQWRNIADGLPNEPKRYWASFERMRRDDHQYALGMVVHHNTDPVTPGLGSAIFLHIWLNSETPTSGCTAMAQADLHTVLTWLRPDAQPLLVQVPVSELASLQL